MHIQKYLYRDTRSCEHDQVIKHFIKGNKSTINAPFMIFFISKIVNTFNMYFSLRDALKERKKK